MTNVTKSRDEMQEDMKRVIRCMYGVGENPVSLRNELSNNYPGAISNMEMMEISESGVDVMKGAEPAYMKIFKGEDLHDESEENDAGSDPSPKDKQMDNLKSALSTVLKPINNRLEKLEREQAAKIQKQNFRW